MPYAGVNGQRLYYEVGGEGEMVVILHGAFADADLMEAPATGLATGLRALRIDRRGYGRSVAADAPIALADEVGDVTALLDWFSAEKTHFLAHDEGAEVALEFALAHPDRTGSIALLAPTLEGYAWSEDSRAKRAEILAAVRANARKGIEEKWLPLPIFDVAREHEGMFERVGDLFRRFNGAAVKYDRPARTGPTQAQRLGEIKAKTAVLIGEREESERLLCARSIALGIAGAEFATVPETGRFLHVEEARIVMRRLTDFFMPEPEIER